LEERQPGAVGREARRRALGEEALPAAIDVHDPQLVLEAVLDLVGPGAGVDDVPAVGRQDRVGDVFPVEQALDVELLRGTLLRQRGDSQSEYEATDERSHGTLLVDRKGTAP